VIDIGKGAAAALWLPGIPLGGISDGPSAATLTLLCGFAAVVGHCFPLWHGFRGGKGAATAVGVLAVIQPLVLLPMLATWLLVLGLSGWVGLSTMLAALSLVPVMAWLHAPAEQLWFVSGLALFLLFTHRGNIRKMLRGTENRFDKAMFRNWLH
jgi:glycerol-3-phosphate acyltransferase PlsY